MLLVMIIQVNNMWTTSNAIQHRGRVLVLWRNFLYRKYVYNHKYIIVYLFYVNIIVQMGFLR